MEELRMPPLREISRMEFFHDGGNHIFGIPVPFSKTWTLEAYDENNNLICYVSKSERHNYLKYARFIIALEDHGYKLRTDDRVYLKSGAKDFLIPSYVPRANRDDLYEITQVSKTRDEVDSIRDRSEKKQRDFAEINGLEYHELLQMFSKW